MTGNEYVLDYLRRHPMGGDCMQIIMAALRDGQRGMMVHSRVADLRKQGYTITCEVEGKNSHGFPRYVYRLCDPTPVPTFPADLEANGAGVRATQESTPTPIVEPLEQMELIA